MRLDKRRDPRSLPTNYQERRRAAALEQQQRARELKLSASRNIVASSFGRESLQGDEHLAREPAEPSEHPLPLGPDDIVVSPIDVRQHWASQLMQPEWLVEIPSNLPSDWYVIPRPEGQRCLVIASKGYTISRLRNGVVADRFESGLPSGNSGTRGGEECILDCVFHGPNSTYYVLGEVVCVGVGWAY